MRLLICTLLALIAEISTLAAQSALYSEKIDSNLWNKVKTGERAEFLVILSEQADVRGAQQFRKKEDKGRYVYETLLETAERSQPGVRALLRANGAPVQSFWIINGVWSKGPAGLIERLAEMPDVARVEDNPVWHLGRPPAGEDGPVQDRVLTPVSWGLTKIKADSVWALGYTGAGVVVGGHDTGYEWEHPALQDKYRGWNGGSADHNYNWHDAIHDTINGPTPNSCGYNLQEPCDDNFHGTHTMGTMVGGANDNITGVAPDAKWIGCRNMEEGDGRPATYIECFEWFVAPTNLMNGSPDPGMAPHVINNSWGCPTSELCNSTNFATMDAVVTNVRASGILVVTSAGNTGPSCNSVDTPPSIFNASFAVGATNPSDGIANFSSRGPVTVYGPGTVKKPNVSAPGVSIYSAYGYDNNPATYTYASYNGTSMAGPHVAGTAALIMSARPDLIGQVDELEILLKTTAVPRYATSPFCGNDNATSLPNNVYGHGRINALAAVNAAIALPVELVSFHAEAQGQATLLRWATATETNCAGFEVQRSADAVHWLILGTLPCSENSVGGKNYDFQDPAPGDGLNYYRLRQVDHSGAYVFSPIVSLRFGTAGPRLRVVAHPAQQQAFFEVLGAATGDRWRVDVLAADGRTVVSAPVEQLLTLPLPGLARGVYAAVLRDERGQAVAVEKMMW